MKKEYNHETHLTQNLLYAGWGTTVFFLLNLVLVGLWLAGSYLPVSDSLLDLDIKMMSFSSAILTAAAVVNLLARILVSVLTRIRISPFSWFVWPVYAVFGGSCLFLASLIRAFSAGFH